MSDRRRTRIVPGWAIRSGVAHYRTFHWTLGRLAWKAFMKELYRPVAAYVKAADGSDRIDHWDNGPHLDTVFEYKLNCAYTDRDDNGLIEIASIWRSGVEEL